MDRVSVSGLQVAKQLHDFVVNEALPGTGIAPDAFWAGLAGLLDNLAPRIKALLAHRDDLQAKIDAWHQANKGKPLVQIPGVMPSMLSLPSGCSFRMRCARADAACTSDPGITEPVPGHALRCFHPLLESTA